MRHIYLAAALSLAQPLAALAAEPPPKKMYPGFYEYYWRLFSCHGQPYFQCDYTRRTCKSGYNFGSGFAGVELAEDRTTVLAHGICLGGTCFNVDTGAVVFKNGLSPNSGSGWFNYDVEQLEHWRAGQDWDCSRQPCHTGPRNCLHNEPPPD
jgi:hypothetical protein